MITEETLDGKQTALQATLIHSVYLELTNILILDCVTHVGLGLV